MRLKVLHEIAVTYEEPARAVIQLLRLKPRNHEGQFVKRWRLEMDADHRLAGDEDALGNMTHLFSIEGPCETINIRVEGEVETENTAGVIRGAVERLPLGLWLRESPLTIADSAVKRFADKTAKAAGNTRLDILHALNNEIIQDKKIIVSDSVTPVSAQRFFAEKEVTPKCLAHGLVACMRSLHIPARFVSGYCFQPDIAENLAIHSWVEAYVEDLGWVGFDPRDAISTTGNYLRVAIGMDAMDAAPIRSANLGRAAEHREARVDVTAGRMLAEDPG